MSSEKGSSSEQLSLMLFCLPVSQPSWRPCCAATLNRVRADFLGTNGSRGIEPDPICPQFRVVHVGPWQRGGRFISQAPGHRLTQA